MDLTGIPQKINRHVIKALYQNARDGLKFGEIIYYVRLCNKNLKPVANLNQTVYKSLKNFQNLGLILKDDNNRYKIVALALSQPTSDFPHCTSPSAMRTLSCRNAAQKRFYESSESDESEQGVDAHGARKRYKSTNNLTDSSSSSTSVCSCNCESCISGDCSKKASTLQENKAQLVDKLVLNSGAPIAETIASQGSYDDQSLLREPGDDDRDSGDDLRMKEDSDKNQENVDNPEQIANPIEDASQNDPDVAGASQ